MPNKKILKANSLVLTSSESLSEEEMNKEILRLEISINSLYWVRDDGTIISPRIHIGEEG